MTPFTQYKPWMIERYGEALFRIPVETASSCPHGRCAFCSEYGARAQQTKKQASPLEQAAEAIRFAKRRYKAKKFMLYIQAFTANLIDPDQQKTILDLLTQFDFTAISIGTRPDCLPEKALDFLEKLKKQVEVWVELGVQTANDETLKAINRGHDWECSRQAILALAERGIHVAPHIILGLPGEQAEPAPFKASTRDGVERGWRYCDSNETKCSGNPWTRTAEELAKLPISGIKIHNLHIMKGTELAAQYADTPFPLLNHWEYAEVLMDFLRRIPAGIPVMRISTDTPDDQLIAPHWHLEKGQFLDYVIQQMTCRQICQGDLANGAMEYRSNGKSKSPPLSHSMTPVPTADGSITFFSEDWKEHYHTKAGARLEAEKKFVEPSGLSLKLKTSNLKLLDVCFGLGNNSLAALCANRADRSVCHSLDITALEMDKRVVRAAAEMFQPLEKDPIDWNYTLSQLLDRSVDFPNLGKIDLQFGDARWLVQNLADDSFDIVFHDPFSSQHCPELWTVEFFRQLRRVMKPEGVLCTYSSAAPVRGAMREADFQLAETVPGHQMGNGTIASPTKLPMFGNAGGTPAVHFPNIGTLLHRGAQIDERRSIPYRDEHLCATSRAILRQRQEAVEAI